MSRCWRKIWFALFQIEFIAGFIFNFIWSLNTRLNISKQALKTEFQSWSRNKLNQKLTLPVFIEIIFKYRRFILHPPKYFAYNMHIIF